MDAFMIDVAHTADRNTLPTMADCSWFPPHQHEERTYADQPWLAVDPHAVELAKLRDREQLYNAFVRKLRSHTPKMLFVAKSVNTGVLEHPDVAQSDIMGRYAEYDDDEVDDDEPESEESDAGSVSEEEVGFLD